MRNKTLGGIALLALASGAAWYWWRNRAAATSPAAKGADAAHTAFGSAGQIGSNFNQDLTPEIVGLAFDYATKTVIDNGPCWLNRGPDQEFRNGGRILWVLSGTNDLVYQWLTEGQKPSTHTTC